MPTQEEIEWIESLGFDYTRYPDFGDFLIENKKVTQDLANACDSQEKVRYVLGYGLLEILEAGLPGGVDGLRVLVDLAKACSKENVGYVFGYGLPEILEAGLPGGVDGLRVLVDLANLSGNYFETFVSDKNFVIWYVEQRLSGNNFSLKELLINFNKLKFPGFSDELYENMDPRISKTNFPEEVSEFLSLADKGRSGFKDWYVDFNSVRLNNLANVGVDLSYWLGKKRFRFKDIVIKVSTSEKTDIIDRELPKLKQWFGLLLDCVVDADFVIKQMLSKIEKADDLSSLFVFFENNPASIVPFVRDIVFSVVQEKSGLNSISENDLRKLVNTFYGKQLARAKARKDFGLSHEVQSEFEFVRAMNHEQLIKSLPSLQAGAYVMSRIDEFAKACPKQGRESDLTRALHELESIAQTIENLLASESEKYKTHFKGKYDLKFRISDKFPLEVLTIGDDGHACIQQGGMAESAGFKFYQDSDALLIEILSTRLFKNPIFRVLKKFERIGFILAFACIDDNNRPVIGLNTVEIAKSWPDDVKKEFYDSAIDFLIALAKKAGFKAIMIGNGYGSEYFTNKFGRTRVSFRKLNPDSEKYYTNTFENGTPIKTEQGMYLAYQGTGAIIWEE